MTIAEVIQALPWQFWWAVVIVALGVYLRLAHVKVPGTDGDLTEIDQHMLTLTGEIRHANELLAALVFEQQADSDDAPTADFTPEVWEQLVADYKAQGVPWTRFRGVKRGE